MTFIYRTLGWNFCGYSFYSQIPSKLPTITLGMYSHVFYAISRQTSLPFILSRRTGIYFEVFSMKIRALNSCGKGSLCILQITLFKLKFQTHPFLTKLSPYLEKSIFTVTVLGFLLKWFQSIVLFVRMVENLASKMIKLKLSPFLNKAKVTNLRFFEIKIIRRI